MLISYPSTSPLSMKPTARIMCCRIDEEERISCVLGKEKERGGCLRWALGHEESFISGIISNNEET